MFTHDFRGNIADSFNEVVDNHGTEIIGGYDVNTIIKEGYPLFSYYAYRSDGFFKNEEEVAKGPHLEGITPKPGDIRYVDKNGDGVINPDNDRFIVGNDFPRYTYGFTYGVNLLGFLFLPLHAGCRKETNGCVVNRLKRSTYMKVGTRFPYGPLIQQHGATTQRLTME
jgi:hypothetical protein